MPKPTMVDVVSSNLRAVGYDEAAREMWVEFKPRAGEEARPVYVHRDVPPEEHQALMNAPSKGSHHAARVKGKYPTERIA